MLRLAGLLDRITEATIRRACNLRYSIEELGLMGEARSIVEEVIESVASRIVFERRGLLRCAICSKGPFTRKGLYLHIMRVHRDYVKELVKKELEARLLGGGSGGAEHAHRG